MTEILNALADPHAKHAIMVHWPIVLTPVGLLLLVWFAATGFKTKTVALAAVVVFLGAMVGAGLAAGSGEEAYEIVEGSVPPLSQAEHDALERHEELGEGAWLWPGACAVLAAGGLLPKPKKAAATACLLAIVASLGVSARFAWTAHTGGDLVYRYGLGVPKRGATPANASMPSVRDHNEDEDDD